MNKLLFYLLTLIMVKTVWAGLLILPEKALKENFPDAKIEKKNIMLTGSQKKEIQKKSRKKLTSSIFTTYIIKKDGKIIGYALLHSHKVRTKNEVILVSFDKDCNVLDVELIAFYEPPEYQLSDNWMKTFKGKNEKEPPVLKRNVPNITGATLSARATTDAVRQSIYICETALKGRFK